jgi:release factor glutamine methyltransferase
MKADQWLREAAAALREASVPYPERDALLLLSQVLQRDKGFLLAHPEATVPQAALLDANGLLARRLMREPVQYIRGVQEFWGIPVRVGPGCLIPRPETEHLMEQTLDLIKDLRSPIIAEVGAGSGCLLLALSKERPDARIAGIEREAEALGWARRNLGRISRVLLARGDLDGDPPLKALDVLVSNPPYVPDEEWDGLPPEVRLFEPPTALRCGSRPLAPYRALARWGSLALKPGGHLVCELGVAQAKRAAALRRLHPQMEWVRGVRDLAGRLRVAVWRRRD